jgi:hypothetical protein
MNPESSVGLTTNARVMSTTIQQDFYRNGQLREQVPLTNGMRHGLVRTWHKNGTLATEEPFQTSLLHGLCRQWDENGRLLGKYKMVHGSGIQRTWHDNGQIQMEISTVFGEFCGRNRTWLSDGTLISESFCLHQKNVSAAEYRAAKDKSLPNFRGQPAKIPPRNSALEKRMFRLFVAWLLKKPHRSEARKWLQKTPADKGARSLGRFKRENDAAKFVEALYEAGATKVIAPDIYASKTGDQFADCLLVQLPKIVVKRKAVRKVCAQLRTRRLGAMQPDDDIGETHLYLSMT